ncbi:MAG: methylated-DNA--[protein]-cysteine S-methyltransferase [Spirochaetia bacterium]|jgi:methylated-DNA-[protein]-cysteine S-methyltransferase|nr:methylated-DNA--[protein]-cysteine S-methyltransferase [Spirochaetia bacterium]
MNIFFHKTILGKIGIAEESGKIKYLLFENHKTIPDAEIKETGVIREAFNQLDAYFKGNLRVFTLPLDPDGTDYMKKIWNLLEKIPYGETASYRDIAAASGNDKAARAVGLANNRNPVPVFIPCHRVIGSSGDLVGYGGGLDIKKKLLDLEKNNLSS